MPSQSWWPLLGGFGLLIFAMSIGLHSTNVPYCGYGAIGGMVLTVFAVILWAVEGPGGYHLHPGANTSSQEKKTKNKNLTHDHTSVTY